MSQPDIIPEWATESDNVVEPVAGRRASGWGIKEQVTSGHINWLFNKNGAWIKHLAESLREMQLGNWYAREGAAGTLRGIATDGKGLWIGVGDGDAGDDELVIGDGVRFAPSGHGDPGWSLNAIATDGEGTWIAVGDAQDDNGTSRGLIKRSTNGGQTWSRRTGPMGVELHGVRFANGIWMACGGVDTLSGSVARSEDGGLTWAAVSASYPDIVTAIAFSPTVGRWACVGLTGANQAASFSDDNGLTWSNSTTSGASFFRGIVWSQRAEAFLAVDEAGSLWSSPDADTWASVNLGHGKLTGIDESDRGDLFVSGANGLILTSTDGGATWTKRPTATTEELLAVAATDLATVIAGAGGALLASLRA